MTRLLPLTIITLLITFSLTGSALQAATTLTWQQIEAGLLTYPPSFESIEQRARLFRAYDEHLNDRLTTYDPALVIFYRKRVDQGLQDLEQFKVTEGVGVFKFYSSSIVLKSKEGIVLVDFCQGPVQNNDEPELTDDAQTRFYWTPGQRDRLANLVDVMLITHRHHDHADISLAKRLIELGKPVVGPAQLHTHWRTKEFASKIRVPQYETIERIGPCELYTFNGAQFGNSIILPDGSKKTISGKNDSEHAVFLIKTGGITFLQAAENYYPLTKWLGEAKTAGFTLNVLLSGGMSESGPSVNAFYPDVFQIPVHDHELKHRGGGNKLYPFFKNKEAFTNHRQMPLMWGEHFLVTKDLVEFTKN